ncbi:MAG TPA: enoyl-CoA hydratase/isomerase family protein [Aestuariivirga sp.]|nr:enoyl-CoA hydratase/isomerase family protein [Aestuariivirga sp.]
MYETVLSEIDSRGVRTITLNRPKSLNAMNRQLIDELALAIHDANADPGTQVIILTGAGRAFCAGDDLNEHVQPASEEAASDHIHAIQRVTETICFGEKPVVGAINGWAVGGGFEWAINCDFPIWAESARAFFPELKWGMFVTGGVTSLLPALAGLHVAREMMVFGERYDARTLLNKGVAWRVVPDKELMSEARAVAGKLTALSQRSLRAMKRVLNQVALVDLKRSIELETDVTVESFLDPDTTRRIAAFSKS